MKTKILLLALLISTSAQAQVFDSSTKVTTAQTKYGKVAGYIERDVYTYKGIPYGKVLRFMPAAKPDSWEGIRSCRHWGPVCPQYRYDWTNDKTAFFYQWNEGYQDEDCLRLNVWTKGLNDGKKRPVLVWLHGGGFFSGNGQDHPGYDGRNLADKGDVVVVSLNHRLNALGYLDLSAFGEKYKYSGSVGMTDIVEALKWVKENIAYVGGNPDCVTIFGQSGGDIGMRVCSYIGIQTEGHASRLALGCCQLVDDLQLGDALHVEAEDVGVEAEIDFPIALAHAGIDNLRGWEPSAEGGTNLSAADAVGAESRLTDDA